MNPYGNEDDTICVKNKEDNVIENGSSVKLTSVLCFCYAVMILIRILYTLIILHTVIFLYYPFFSI